MPDSYSYTINYRSFYYVCKGKGVALESNSKSIWVDKIINDDELIIMAKKYKINNFNKPRNTELEKNLEKLLVNESRSIIVDAGCGIGQSSFIIAGQNPDCLVLGIDKSISRLDRKNSFKKDLPDNLKFIHCDLLDFYPLYFDLSVKYELKTLKQFFLYPNPWPKLKSIKKRFHASPILPFIMQLDSPIEFRSNWKRYLEEFAIVSKGLFKRKIILEKLEPKDTWMTPFEKKYDQSGQELFKLEVQI